MTPCRTEGDLRAYLDRELPTAEMQQVAEHLKDCTACDGLCTELAARAAHVSALMELLPGWEGAAPRPAVAARRRMVRPNWVGIAVALAAGLALAAYLLPKRQAKEVRVVRVAPMTVSPAAEGARRPTASTFVTATTQATDARRRGAGRKVKVLTDDARRSSVLPEYFVALDDEPFDSGFIMRVDVQPGNAQADIVFGPDGRAHAFRLVAAAQRNF